MAPVSINISTPSGASTVVTTRLRWAGVVNAVQFNAVNSVTTTSRTSKTTVGSFIPLSATVGSVAGVSLRLRGRRAGGEGAPDVGQGRIVPQRRMSALR